MSRKTPSRRAVIQGGAAALTVGGLPGCSDGQQAETGLGTQPGQVDHVIVVMMENRSFDHYLGALKLVEGREDVDGLTGDEVNLDPDGQEVHPAPLPEPCQEDPPHGWSSSHRQFADGANSGFVTEHAGRTREQAAWAMAYLQREDLPIHYALADAYALPDQFFCSVLGPTWPNRLYGQLGTSGGMTGNDRDAAPFAYKSVYQALEEVGQDWRYYYVDVPFIGLLADHWDEARVNMVSDFFADAEAGTLPQLSWVDPGFSFNDDHPPHHPGLGQVFLATIYEALAQSPAWERCLLVITYDEHGGFYDHVPPPTTDDDHIDEGFGQMGFRVPALAVGPWVTQGVDHTVFDNTSVLKYLCERFGMEPWTRRIAAANSIGVLLDRERMEAGEPLAPVVLPSFSVPGDELGDECQYSFRGGRSGQPELEDFLRETKPEMVKMEGAEQMHEWLLAKARELGVIV